ncbi:hypothetical protein E1202_08315 [Saccharopolyspora karakumensis]|uniref:Uncharacterized protein n=1 Tax=Saccharopolyspora karakumensis TaxID=2530386 RepID=A0A4R5BWR8_9PSEU|nr:DUF6069 family protein [Saccharopolyspora karakumensis]TDD90619.1 hypothetical protein E1202_08315 [Saccharopolyspora karakumensis]
MSGSAEARYRDGSSRRLWSGGLATAVVAALTAVVGILVIRRLLGIQVLAPKEAGAWGDASTVGYALGSAGLAVVATALLQVLLRTTPRALSFFQWIMLLLVVIAVVLPLSLDASLDTRIATAVLNLVIGWTITAMISGVAVTRRRSW